MTTSCIRIGLALVALMLPGSAFAARSSSFILEEGSNAAETYVAGSTSYTLNENGISWNQLPLASTSFQITTNFTATASSAAASSQSSSESSVQQQQGGGTRAGGGRAIGSRPDVPGTKPAAPIARNPMHERVLQRQQQRLALRFSPSGRMVLNAIRRLRRALLQLSPKHAAAPFFVQQKDAPETQLHFFRSGVPERSFRSRAFMNLRGELLGRGRSATASLAAGSTFLLLLLLIPMFARAVEHSEGLLCALYPKKHKKMKTRRRSPRSRRS